MKKLSFLLTLSKQVIASMVVLAVLTLGFMVTVTSCHNSLTGTDSLLVPACALHADDPSARQTGQELPTRVPVRRINIYFNIKNGGLGLMESHGKVVAEDESYSGFANTNFAINFSISLAIPSRENHVKIYWEGKEFVRGTTCLSARLNLTPGVQDYTILINLKGKGKVVTEGIDEVHVWEE